MFPTDPVKTASHNRLMQELKDLFVQGYLNSDLKRAIRERFQNAFSRMTNKFSLDKSDNKTNSATDFAQVHYFSTKRIAVYTAVFGPVDDIQEPIFSPDNCEFFIFTDQPLRSDSAWIKRSLEEFPESIRGQNVLMNRYVKMFPDRFFPTYDCTIYLDGKYQARTDLTEFIQEIGTFGIKMFPHPLRRCVYQEITTCIKAGKGNPKELLEYQKRLKNAGMPENYGMLEGGIIVREVGHSLCQKLMLSWWEEFSQFAKRDQISLPFILWQNQIPISDVAFEGRNIWTDPAIRKYPHRKNGT